jgi:hypothetical protein
MDLDESSDMKFWKSQIVLRPDQKVPNVWNSEEPFGVLVDL